MRYRPQRLFWIAFGASGMWSLHLLAVVATGSARCVRVGGGVDRFTGIWWVLVAMSVAAILFGAWCTWVSARTMRRSSPESSAHLVHFLGFGGLLLNGVFMIGLGFSTLALWLVPVCF